MKITIAALALIVLASGCSTTGKKENTNARGLTEPSVGAAESAKTKRAEAKELFESWVRARGNARHFRKPDSNNLYIQLILHPYGEEQLLDGLHYKKPWIRDLSETALAGKNSDYFREKMNLLAIEGGDFERERAIKALVNSRDQRTADLLIERLQNDPWAQNRENSANYLRYFESEDASEALLRSLEDEERVIATSINTLSLYGDKRVITRGRDALFRIQHPQLLGRAIEAYSRFRTPEALEIIIARLSIEADDDWSGTLEKYKKELKELTNQ